MTASIRLLDPVVADAIAAGEVVERPASVVKELVENAIDAGARTVSIEVDGAGLQRIVVVDDGEGIDAGELALAFTRHATSKLSSIQDLSRVSRLGFRGEALASIAAVARVECRSTRRGAGEGASIRVEHGAVGVVVTAAPVPGTSLTVSGLFESTPARRAFLKRPPTEVAAVVRAVTCLALAHPGVAFRLEVDGRRVLSVAGDGDLRRAFRELNRGAGDVLAVTGGRGEARVEGLLAEPSAMRRSREQLYLCVNRRPVASRSLGFAVEQAYRGLAEPGMFPLGVLHVSIPPELVDVNVHPTKREVRFRDERALFGMIQEAALAALRSSATYAGAALFRTGADHSDGDGWGAAVAVAEAPPAADPTAVVETADQLQPALPLPAGIPGATLQPALTGIEEGHLLRGPYRLVGQVMDCYIAAEGPSGLVLVDQHAAHERIVFNRLVATRGRAPRQPLLVPQLIYLTPVQAAGLAEFREDLATAGLEIEEFGSGSARLVAYDPALPATGLDRLALEVLDSLLSEAREVDLVRRLERATYTVACHSAIRFGQRLGREEMEALLRDLEVADPGITCPHGRPTLLEISDTQLRREFRRS